MAPDGVTDDAGGTGVKRKPLKWAGIVLAVGLALLGAAYVWFIGFTRVDALPGDAVAIYNANGLSRIGANAVGIRTDAGWVLVDTGLGPLAGAIAGKLAKTADLPVTLAFNTHWHPDHSGGNAAFTADARIVAHANTRAILARPHEGFGLTKPGAYRAYEPRDAAGLPEETVDESAQFTVGGLALEAVHYPAAHTGGDLVVYAPARKLAVIGDLVWPGALPFVDVENGGSARGLLAALDGILSRTDDSYTIVAGHGPALTRADVMSYRDMVAETIAFVADAKAAGATLDDLLAAGLPESWSAYASTTVPPEQWARMVFKTL